MMTSDCFRRLQLCSFICSICTYCFCFNIMTYSCYCGVYLYYTQHECHLSNLLEDSCISSWLKWEDRLWGPPRPRLRTLDSCDSSSDVCASINHNKQHITRQRIIDLQSVNSFKSGLEYIIKDFDGHLLKLASPLGPCTSQVPRSSPK